MYDMKIYENSEFGSVRTLSLDGIPYFVGKDVAEILGYSNTKDAISVHVDEEDKRVIQRSENTTFEIPNRGLTVINESGMYSLVLSSKLPNARKFKRWITNEVLPTIRRHGVYAVDELLENPDMLIAALTELKAEREHRKLLEHTVAVQNQQISEMKPKASYYDVVLNCKDLVAISTIAKDYGWSANRMNRYLYENGVQFKQGNKIWLLYQKYAEKGYTSTKTHSYTGNDGTVHTRVHTYWTQQGRLFMDFSKRMIYCQLWNGRSALKIDIYNSERYYDPTPYAALTSILTQEEAALRAAAPGGDGFRPVIYVCSPYSGNIEENVCNARRYCRFALESRTIPIAPHLLYPQFMNDSDPAERYLATHTINYVLLGKCRELWVFGDVITEGMESEIRLAKRWDKTIRYFTSELKEVKR
jgi:anti-repressor protein